jgi:hypothetical protein
MSDEAKKEIELVDGWVRGGTTSAAHDREQARLKADAERRRAVQDKQFALANQSPGEARLSSLDLGSKNAHATVVLGIKHPKDNQVLDWITCELITQPRDDGDVELVLNMACPSCAQRDAQNAQFKFAQSHYMFWLDTKDAGQLWINPAEPSEVFTLAGAITTKEWIPCPGLGCPWKFRIDKSILYMERK